MMRSELALTLHRIAVLKSKVLFPLIRYGFHSNRVHMGISTVEALQKVKLSVNRCFDFLSFLSQHQVREKEREEKTVV